MYCGSDCGLLGGSIDNYTLLLELPEIWVWAFEHVALQIEDIIALLVF